MNVEIGTEAAQFPEKEYINGIFVAVHLLAGDHERATVACLNFLYAESYQSQCTPLPEKHRMVKSSLDSA